MTRSEQLAGIDTIRKWPHEDRAALVKLPTAERNLVILAAALLDIAPGEPVTHDVLEIKLA